MDYLWILKIIWNSLKIKSKPSIIFMWCLTLGDRLFSQKPWKAILLSPRPSLWFCQKAKRKDLFIEISEPPMLWLLEIRIISRILIKQIIDWSNHFLIWQCWCPLFVLKIGMISKNGVSYQPGANWVQSRNWKNMTSLFLMKWIFSWNSKMFNFLKKLLLFILEINGKKLLLITSFWGIKLPSKNT